MTNWLLADSQGKYFDNLLEEHHILTLFNSGDKIEDLLPKHMEVIPSFNLIILQIGNNNSRDNEVTILTKMQQLYEGICNINPKAQVFTCLLNYQLSFPCKVIEHNWYWQNYTLFWANFGIFEMSSLSALIWYQVCQNWTILSGIFGPFSKTCQLSKSSFFCWYLVFSCFFFHFSVNKGFNIGAHVYYSGLTLAYLKWVHSQL